MTFHLEGEFVRDLGLLYRGYEHAELNVDVDRLSFFEALGELGCDSGIRLWWRMDGPRAGQIRPNKPKPDGLEAGGTKLGGFWRFMGFWVWKIDFMRLVSVGIRFCPKNFTNNQTRPNQ